MEEDNECVCVNGDRKFVVTFEIYPTVKSPTLHIAFGCVYGYGCCTFMFTYSISVRVMPWALGSSKRKRGKCL